MVKAPIVSRACDHKRQRLRILPRNRHFIAAPGLRMSRQRFSARDGFAACLGYTLSQRGTLTMTHWFPHK